MQCPVGWTRIGLRKGCLCFLSFHKNYFWLKQNKWVLAIRTNNIQFFERNNFLREMTGKVVLFFLRCTDPVLPFCLSLAVVSWVSSSEMVLLNLAAWVLSAQCGPEAGTLRQGPAVLKCVSFSVSLLDPAPPLFPLAGLKWTAFLFFPDIPLSTSIPLFTLWKSGCNNVGWQDNIDQGQQPISCRVNYHLVNNGSSPCAFLATAGTLQRPFPLSRGKWGGLFVYYNRQ